MSTPWASSNSALKPYEYPQVHIEWDEDLAFLLEGTDTHTRTGWHMCGHDVISRLRLLSTRISGKNLWPIFRQTDVKIIVEESMEVTSHGKIRRHSIVEEEKNRFLSCSHIISQDKDCIRKKALCPLYKTSGRTTGKISPSIIRLLLAYFPSVGVYVFSISLLGNDSVKTFLLQLIDIQQYEHFCWNRFVCSPCHVKGKWVIRFFQYFLIFLLNEENRFKIKREDFALLPRIIC
jgi:hypothetical protein